MAAKTKQPTEEVIVRSVRYNGRTIKCEWDHGGDPCARTFHDNPLPSFLKALAALGEHVCALCELPAKDVEKIEVTGITVRALGDDNQQALITAKKRIRKGKRVFNISTPLLAMWEPKAKEEKATTDNMDEATAKAIAKVESETKKYIIGERAQGKLALGDDEPAKGKKESAQEDLPGIGDDDAGKN
jgi:hypothetical protein